MTINQSKRHVGTSVYGLRMPIITQGADIAKIITENIINAAQAEYQPVTLNNRDIIGITEAFVARSQGNYISLDDIAHDVSQKFPSGDVAVAFPILSRNRFGRILEGIARGVKGKVYVCLSYPADEVGNPVMDEDALYETEINLYTDVLTEQKFKETFGTYKHIITQTDYAAMYKTAGHNIEIIYLNNPKDILKFTNQIVVASIHTRRRHKQILEKAGANVLLLDEICATPTTEHGWSEYGVLGSNCADNDRLKLFPRDTKALCQTVQQMLFEKTGKKVEVMVYGDGGFKCPRTKIWEFADPVVSPGFTDGLTGTPCEIKIKLVADNHKDNPQAAIEQAIAEKKGGDSWLALGTTPRQITDLVGSLCDLTTGSGDKGTPVVVIKGYFDDYTKPAPQE